MTILTAHPNHSTATERTWDALAHYAHMQPLRRLFSFSTSKLIVDVLRNRVGIERPSWDRSITVGTITVAIIRKNGGA